MTHVTVGAQTSDPLQASALPKELSRQLLLAIPKFYLGRQAGRHRAPPVHVYTWTLLDVGRIALARLGFIPFQGPRGHHY